MPLDEDDKKAISEMIAGGFATALASSETAKALVRVVEGQIKGLKLDEKFSAIDEQIKAKPGDDSNKGGEGDGNKGGASFTETPEYKRMQAEIEETRKQMQRAREEAAQAESARKAEALSSGVRDALLQAGADPKRIGFAMSHLTTSGAIKLDDKGVPAFVVRDAYGEQLVPAADHAAKWLGTDDGKFFAPPTGTTGTGDKAGNAGNRGGGQGRTATVDQLGNALLGGIGL